MTPGQYNFTIYQGSNDGLVFQIKDAGVPLDLTGYSAAMKIRKNHDSAAPLFTATSLGLTPNIIITPLTGIVSISILPSDTMSIPFKGSELETVYDIELTSPTGIVSRVLMGKVVLSREVTHD